MTTFGRTAQILAIIAAFGGADAAAAAASHRFHVTYRDWVTVRSVGSFRPTAEYDLRFEGCWAHHSDEAICGFTLRPRRPLTVTNLANASHAAAADGAVKRTCCMFIQGNGTGYPIVAGPDAAGAGILSLALPPGRAQGLMLRVPNYRAGGPLASITFSSGGGEPGLSFPAKVKALD